MGKFEHIIDLIIAVIVILIFPLFYFGLKQDSLMTTVIDTETQLFVDDIRSKGFITKDMYDDYSEILADTGLLYNINLEYKHINYEPEYRLRTVEEVIDEQNGTYTGSNTYHPYSVFTDIPPVTDPIHEGTLNTDTNESVLARAVNTPASPSHIHTDDCIGSGNTNQKVYAILNWGSSSRYNNTGSRVYCSNCNNELFSAANSGTAFTSPPEAHMNTVYRTYGIDGNIVEKTYSDGYFRNFDGDDIPRIILSAGDNFRNYIASHPNTLIDYGNDESGSYTIHKTEDFIWDPNQKIPSRSWEKVNGEYTHVIRELPFIGCVYCNDAPYACDSIIQSITPTHPVQMVYIGESLITTAVATYLDGSTKTIVCNTDFITNQIVKNKQVTLTYLNTVGAYQRTLSCNIDVTVIPRNKVCVNGHTYNLNMDGTDPSCPYCRAWLRSLIVYSPLDGSITIYRGTTLEENGVTLLATYLDGRTEMVESGYLDNLDRYYIGSQNVTISYKGKYVNLTVINKRNIKLCSVCGRYYELYPDDSDPGCPYCQAETPIFTGNVMEYKSIKYLSDILKELYEGRGIYYFSNKDYINLTVKSISKSRGRKLLGSIYKNIDESNLTIKNGGYIREDGQ